MNGSLYHIIICKGEALWYEDDNEEIGNSVLMENDFYLIEEQQDIEIQDIEEIIVNENGWSDEGMQLVNTVNKLVKVVKELDRKINTSYCENCGVELNKENTALPNMCWECKYGTDEEK